MGLTLQKAARIARYSMAPNKPYHVQWMITRKCNYRCKGCNVWREQDMEELSTEEVKRGLDILRELGVVEIVFSGGNPLLREDIGEILDYASRFFITTVYDNGSTAAEKMDALRCVDFVAISLDSLDSRKNDYVKGVKGSWEKAMQTIEKLHANGIRVGVSPTISQFNLYEMVDFTNYFLEKGIPVWYCLYSYDSFKDSNQLFKIGRKNDEFVITNNKAMVELCDSLMDMERKNSNVLITAKTLEAVKNLYLNGKRIWRCRALRNFFIIDHLGRVAGCHLNKPVASIFDLPKVWNSEEFNALRRVYSECSKCIYLCYIVYSLHGSVVGNFEIAREKWRSAKLFLRKRPFKSLSLAKQR
ncbi:MAG: radical SAM protein [Candidatus Bathycorpusculaceae bacterium]